MQTLETVIRGRSEKLRTLKNVAWTVWIVLALLALTVPFNPVLNQPMILFPFYLVSAVVGIVAVNIAITTTMTIAKEGSEQQ